MSNRCLLFFLAFAGLLGRAETSEASLPMGDGGLTVSINMPEIFDTHVARLWNLGTDMEYLQDCRKRVRDFQQRKDTLSVDYCKALNDLARAYLAIGDEEKAIIALAASGPRMKELYGENSYESASTYYIYALATAQSGDYLDATDMASKVLRILNDIHRAETEAQVDALLLRSSCYSHTGVLGSAKKDVNVAMVTAENIFGKDSRQYDNARFQAAQIMYRSDNGVSRETMQWVVDSYEWRCRHLGQHHPDAITALLALANLKSKAHKYDESERLYNEFYALQMTNVKSNFINMTLEEQRQYWHIFQHYYLELIPQMVLEKVEHSPYASTPSEVCYNTALFSKGILLNSEKLMQEALRQTENGVGLRLKTEILQERVKLMQQLAIPASSRKYDVEGLRQSIDQKQQRLIAMLKVYEDYTKGLTTNWKQIKQSLQADEVAVEFLCIPRNKQIYTLMRDETDSTVVWEIPSGINENEIYAAVVLCNGAEKPIFIPLFDLKEMDAQKQPHTPKAQQELSKLIWKPIMDVSGADQGLVKRIYFSPVGELYNWPIESYPHWSNDGLVSDGLSLYRVSSTRELINRSHTSNCQGAVVYGGLNYDSGPATPNSERGAVGELAYLEGTLKEAEKVASLLKTKGMSVELLTGEKGTVTSFRQLSGKQHRIIHIGTHGFYNVGERESSTNAEELTLQRSGLFFSSGRMLTSLDVAQLELKELDFIALSACQTGEGEITGDGVFGLQRGFKKAGAQSILMSLWKVDDEATCLLMTEFYKNWIGEGKTKHDALELAKQIVRSHKEKGWDKPEYWAAFILLDGID